MLRISLLVLLCAATAFALALAKSAPSPAQSTESYKSRPDLQPPKVTVYKRNEGLARGLVFVAPKVMSGNAQTGRLILDDAGEPVWFDRDDRGERTNDFRVQTYRGKPVLTWWEGESRGGYGYGTGVIADTSYDVIKRVRTKRPNRMDMHEFKLTPRGTALVIIYHPRRRGRIMDNVIQEIDVRTGKVLFSWRALRHIRLKESYRDRSEDKGEPWDYFHINSVEVDRDGNYLISARYSNSVTKISRRTGRVIWRLGGKRSDFRMGKRARFQLAHDARWERDGKILRVFDNRDPEKRSRSRIIRLRVNQKRKRVRLLDDVRHPEKVLAATQANAQLLPNGNIFVGWGSQGRHSEFGPDGDLLYDAEMADGFSSYRAYRAPWVGRPDDRPAVAAEPAAEGSTAVYASWNGATEVARWRVLAGAAGGELAPAGEAAKQGFETAIGIPGRPARVAVQALDAAGKVLGTSSPVAAGGS